MAKNKILIVDDTSYVLYYIEKIFSDNDFQKFNLKIIGKAKNGIEAIKMYEQKMPVLTFMDISMPKMDGLEALKEIKKRNKGALVIFITAFGYKKEVLKAAELGAAGYILKPFKKEQILELLEKLKNKGELK